MADFKKECNLKQNFWENKASLGSFIFSGNTEVKSSSESQVTFASQSKGQGFRNHECRPFATGARAMQQSRKSDSFQSRNLNKDCLLNQAVTISLYLRVTSLFDKGALLSTFALLSALLS